MPEQADLQGSAVGSLQALPEGHGEEQRGVGWPQRPFDLDLEVKQWSVKDQADKATRSEGEGEETQS